MAIKIIFQLWTNQQYIDNGYLLLPRIDNLVPYHRYWSFNKNILLFFAYMQEFKIIYIILFH